MKTIIPKKLKTGDTIGFLSCAGSIEDTQKLEIAKEYFAQQGYKVKISQNSYKNYNYLSGTDEERANALNDFFKDKTINAIITTRGGYGSLRILDLIDYEAIKKNPKIFAGYSDITALQIMIYKKTGLITYNAPMVCPDFGNNLDKYTEQSFFDVLKNDKKEFKIDTPKIFKDGISNGIIWGGNLSTIQSLCGLDFIPNEKFIFVVEDINEPAYKIDKMFTQLLNIKQFKENLSAIILGNFSGIDNIEYFNNYFEALSKFQNIPIIAGFKFGHEKQKQTFPFGLQATINTKLNLLTIN